MISIKPILCKGSYIMNIGWNIETYLTVASIIISVIGSMAIIKVNWKQYGSLFLINGLFGEIICYLFVKLGFYSFPYRLFPRFSPIPFLPILIVLPFLVLIGVRYSPKEWKWKIPYYWVFVHLVILVETLVHNTTQLIKYEKFWLLWESYTLWWVFFLVFELIGGLIISDEFRKPLNSNNMIYGKLGWYFSHIIFILTIFLAGYYLGYVHHK